MKNKILQGPILKELFKYILPLLFSMLIQQSYQTVDAFIIGRYAGANALGAIDSTYGFIKLLINSTISLTAAASVIIARNYGASYIDKARSLIKGLLVFVIFIGAVKLFYVYNELSVGQKSSCNIFISIRELLIFGMPAAIQSILFSFSNIYLQAAINSCGSTVVEMSSRLMRLIAPFYVTSIGAELFSGILRGHGKAKTPTVLTLVGTVGGRILWLTVCGLLSQNNISFIIWAYPFSWILTTLLFICFGKKYLFASLMDY